MDPKAITGIVMLTLFVIFLVALYWADVVMSDDQTFDWLLKLAAAFYTSGAVTMLGIIVIEYFKG